MKSEPYQRHGFLRVKRVIAYFFAMTAATALLAGAGPFNPNDRSIVAALPLLALPQPPLLLMADPGSTIAPIKGTAARAQTVARVSPDSQQGAPNPRVPFYGIIVEAAARYEVDPHLIRAIILAESGYNPKAKSKKGARGLMQLMPATAEELGVQNIYDPEENIDGGVRYFRILLDRFDGDVQLALAAYNAGSRHVRNYEGIPPFKATQHYVEKVLQFQKKFKRETRRLEPAPVKAVGV